MELRFERGDSCNATVLLQTEAGRRFDARVIAMVGKRLTISSATPFEPGTALKVEWSRHIVMGEVIEAGPNGTAVLHLRHAVTTDDIHEILQRWG